MNLANHAKPSKNSSSKYLFATKQKKIHESFVSKKNRLSFILVIKCKQTFAVFTADFKTTSLSYFQREKQKYCQDKIKIITMKIINDDSI